MSNAANNTGYQLHMFGAKSGVEVFRPYAHGDIIVTKKNERHVIIVADSNNDGGVFVTARLGDGAECVVLEREIAYRTNKA